MASDETQSVVVELLRNLRWNVFCESLLSSLPQFWQIKPLETDLLALMNDTTISLKSSTLFTARIFVQANVEWQMAAEVFSPLPSKRK